LSAELDIIPELEEKLEALTNDDESVKTKITVAKQELTDLRTEFNTITQELQTILSDASALKSERKLLKSEKTDDLDEFEINIKSNEDKLQEKSTEYLELQKMKFVYDTLLPIWGENGVKRDFINSVLDPINAYIKEDLEHLRMYFKVELDNNFDAHIYEFNNEIDPETLSSGESKRINLIIMLAYIKILRQRKDMNILILDEVFTTIDLEGIDDILILLKAFAHERKINIFLVHHTELKEWFFDKIIAVNKTTFSNMTTIQRT
jgi:DNA repair exonuclease SbcCD ATPase subunit